MSHVGNEITSAWPGERIADAGLLCQLWGLPLYNGPRFSDHRLKWNMTIRKASGKELSDAEETETIHI
jgi:hypothetical protein